MRYIINETFPKDKPYLIIGKGPSFSRIYTLNLKEFYTIGLNDVLHLLICDYAHLIDLRSLHKNHLKCSQVLIPFHPHINFRPSKKTVNEFVSENDILQKLEKENKLITYDLSTYKKKYNCDFLIRAKYFSAEAVFDILCKKGVKEICSIGIDGGNEYAKEFTWIKPLRNGQPSYDKQFTEIYTKCKKYNVNYQRL